MESNYEQLVKALRCKRDDCEGCDLSFFDKDEGWMCQYAAKDDDAADAIEALENALADECAECDYLVDENARLTTENEALQAQLPKRGKWKPFDLTWGRSIYSCTVCGEAADVPTANGKALYKYCPRCGAKMEVQE